MAIAKGPKPSEILTPASFRNAQVVLQAIGGSTNGLIHLTAIANRTAHRIDLEAFDKLGREVPVLIDLKPSGEHYMEHFHHAGGVAETDGAARRPDRPRLPRPSPARPCAMSSPRAEEVPGQDVDPRAQQSDQAGRRDGGAARQPRAARRGDQAFGGEPQAAAAHRPRRGVRIRGRHDVAGRRSRARRRPPTTCWCCATPAPRARRACRRRATCRSRGSWRAPASRTWCGSRTRA